jgi:hypothetical protein
MKSIHLKNIVILFGTGSIFFLIFYYDFYKSLLLSEFLGAISVYSIVLPIICLLISIVKTIIQHKQLKDHWNKTYKLTWLIFIILLGIVRLQNKVNYLW